MEMRSVSQAVYPMPPTLPPVRSTRPKLHPTAQPPAPATNVARTATNVRTGVLLCGIIVAVLALAACSAGPDYRAEHARLRTRFVDYVAAANATGRGALSTPLVRADVDDLEAMRARDAG